MHTSSLRFVGLLHRFRFSGVAAIVAAIFLSGQTASAVDVNWLSGGTTDWNTGTNWSTGNPPGTGDVAHLDIAGATTTLDANDPGVNPTIQGMFVGETNGTVTFNQSLGTLTTTAKVDGGNGGYDVGRNSGSVGIVNQSGGELDVNGGGWLILGANAGSTGTYNLSGGTLNTNGGGRLEIGNAGNGTFRISNNAVANISGLTEISSNTGTGTLRVDGGTLNTKAGLVVGWQGTANVLQTAGTVNNTGTVVVGQSAGTGTYTMQGGTLTSSSDILLSQGNGSGTFNQTGGSVTITNGWLRTGQGTQASAYNISGNATLSVTPAQGRIQIGENATGQMSTFTQSDNSVVTAAGRVYIGAGGNGTYTLNGGTLNVGNDGNNSLNLASTAASTGILNINGGTLSIANGDAFIGNSGNGTVNQVGGLAAFHNNGASWTFIGNNSGTGVYNLSGGTMTEPNRMMIGNNTSNGTFNLMGGVAIINDIEPGNGTKNFNFSGGTLRVGTYGMGTLKVQSFSGPSVLDVTTQNTTLGGLDVEADTNGATIRVGTGRTLQVNGNAIANSGNVTYTQTGGTFNTTGWFSVASANATSVFNLSGGTVNAGGDFNITDAGGTGTLNQSGTGTLNVNGGEYFVGKDNSSVGIVNQTGGTTTVATGHSLHLTNGGASTGTYILGNGTAGSGVLITPNVAPGGGVSTFNFNGGKLQPNANNPTYLEGLTAANVQAGGAVINTNGFNITINQTLQHDAALGASPDGGLTLSDSAVSPTPHGSLTLSAPNTYTGPTNINAGGAVLVTNTAGSATGTGPVNVNGGGTLRGATTLEQGVIAGLVTVNNGGTLGGANGATLTLQGGLTLAAGSSSTFDLTGSPNGNSTPLVDVTGGALTVAGTHTINFTGTPSAGTYDIFSYTGTAPTFSNFMLGIRPGAFTYTLINNTAQNQIDVQLTPPLTWTGRTGGNGAVNSSWDLTATNWAGGNVPQAFVNSAGVTFTDTNAVTGATLSSPQGVVIRAGGVQPGTVTFSNNSVDYVLSNAGGDTVGIAGAASITVNGTGTATLSAPNSLTGAIAIQSGRLRVQNTAALGSSAGASVSSGGALELQSGSGATAVYGNLVSGSGTIPLVLNGTGLAASPAGSLRSVNGVNTYTGAVTIGASGATITSASAANGDSLTFTNFISVPTGSTLTFTGPGNVNITTSGLSGGGAVTYSGTGVLSLGGVDNYTGLTTVDSGTVVLVTGIPSANSVVLGDVSANTPGVLQLGTSAAAVNQTLASLTTAGSGVSSVVGGNASVATLTLPNITGPTFLAATLGGPGANQNNLALVFGGGGTLSLSSANTYNGGTTVNGSTLSIASDAATGPAELGTAPAAPTTNITLNNSTLQFTAPLTLAANRSIVLQGGTDNIDTQGNDVSYAGAISGNSVLDKFGIGSLTYTGTTTGGPSTLRIHAGSITVGNGGSFTTTGFSSIAQATGDVASMTVKGNGQVTFNGDFNVSDLTGTTGVLNIQDTAVVKGNTLYVGKNGNSDGYVNQSGGSFSPAGGGGDWRIGGAFSGTDSASVGVWNISGGTFSTNNNFQVGAFGSGEMNISGTGAVTTLGGTPSIGRFAGGFGVLDVSGGSFTQGPSTPNGLLMIIGEQGTGVLNVRGGTVTVSNTTSSNGGGSQYNALDIAHTSTGTGIVNLLSGTLRTRSVGSVAQNTPGASSTVNFNGGTLQATGNTSSFMQNLTNAYVYSGGATIDTNGFNVTVSQPLLAPSGFGVTSIPIQAGNGGSGYVSPPIVQINGDGVGATAVATVSNGVVTGIVITNPGVGYSNASANLLGGHPTTTALPDPAITAANASGALNKVGAGTLTLGGANTYTGATNIKAGTLRVPQYQPGLFEGLVNNANSFDLLNSIPQTSVQGGPRLASDTVAGQAYPIGLPNNSTVGYIGSINNNSGSTVTWTFAENFDDGLYLAIDGNQVLNNNDFATPTTANYTLTPGRHTFELRLGQGNGGVGPSNQQWLNNGIGFGYDPQGRNQQVAANYLPITGDPGSGFTFDTGNLAGQVLPATTSVVMSSNTTLDMTGATQTVGSLADATGPTPTGAQVLVGTGVLTTGNDNTNTTFSGKVSLGDGTAGPSSGGNLTKTGTGIFTVANTGGLALGNNSSVNVNGGTLKLAVTSGSANVGTGVTATITGNSTLELAGSVSVLGTSVAGHRTNIVNDSTASPATAGTDGAGPAGVVASAGNQQVGGIDGTGSVRVNMGASLTADHVIAGALVIGGSSSTGATMTIAASDSSGNPLGEAGGLAVAGSLTNNSPIATSTITSANVPVSAGSLTLGSTVPGVSLGGGIAAVPEPSTLLLVLLGGLAFLARPAVRRLRRG